MRERTGRLRLSGPRR